MSLIHLKDHTVPGLILIGNQFVYDKVLKELMERNNQDGKLRN